MGERAAASGGAPAFSYDDVPSQLLRINSLEGSLAFSGSVLTGVTDVSAAGETVTVTGSPVYTAVNANLNGAPSFTSANNTGLRFPDLDRSQIAYIAAVYYRPGTALQYIWDADESSGRHYLYTASSMTTHRGGISVAGSPWAEPVAGRHRTLAAFDGSTPSSLNGTDFGTYSANTASGSGLTLGYSGVVFGYTGTSHSFLMACSAAPSLALRTSLEAKLLADFG